MMTLRRHLAALYDWTGLSSRIYRSRAWEIGALAAVGASVLLLILIYHVHTVGLGLSDLPANAGSIGMEHMFGGITLFTRVVFLLPAFFLLTNAVRMYWITMHRGVEQKIPLRCYAHEAKVFILHWLTQPRFRQCTDRDRWVKHMLLVTGCILMFVLLFFTLEWFQTDAVHPIYHPQRWLGYLATAAILYPTAEILMGRIRRRSQVHRFSESSDWIFPVLLLLTALSGIAIHAFRYMELGAAAHYMYAAHMIITVPMLIVEIPFGKWSHVLYRPLAAYLQAVKERAVEEESMKETILQHAS
jgi:hypothetical protein